MQFPSLLTLPPARSAAKAFLIIYDLNALNKPSVAKSVGRCAVQLAKVHCGVLYSIPNIQRSARIINTFRCSVTLYGVYSKPWVKFRHERAGNGGVRFGRGTGRAKICP